jgi:hypothetical protein
MKFYIPQKTELSTINVHKICVLLFCFLRNEDLREADLLLRTERGDGT